MSDLLGLTIEDVLAALRKRRAALPFEIGAFVALEACEAMMRGPAPITPADVRIGPDGAVSVFAEAHSASPDEAAQAVAQLLASLLVAAGPGVPAGLVGLIERDAHSLEHLRADIEATLVPLNRSASRRVLARIVRDLGAPALASPPGRDAAAASANREPANRGHEPGPTRGQSSPPPPPPRARVDSRPPEARLPPVRDPSIDAPPPRRAPAPIAASRNAPSSVPPPPRAPAPSSRPAPPAPAPRPANPKLPEPKRSSVSGTLIGTPSPQSPDSALDALLDSNPSSIPPPNLANGKVPPAPRLPREVRDGSIKFDIDESQRFSSPGRSSPGRSSSGSYDRTSRPGQTSTRTRLARSERPDEFERAAGGGSRRGVLVLLGILIAVAGLAGGVLTLRPDVLARIRGERTPQDIAEEARRQEQLREREAARERERNRFGDLVVRVTPERAQILVLVGRGPAVATKLPVGVAHEFVAITDGRGPTRAVVPPNAEWEQTPEGPRYEIAMQTSDTAVAFDDLDLGPTRLPQNVGTPGSQLGDIRVVTTPRGARVYQVIGFSPEVAVESIRTDEPLEILAYAPDHRVKRVTLAPSEWRAESGRQRATVEITLDPRPPTPDAGPAR